MPIIVLRDHATFAPLDLASAGVDRHVDAALIAAEGAADASAGPDARRAGGDA